MCKILPTPALAKPWTHHWNIYVLAKEKSRRGFLLALEQRRKDMHATPMGQVCFLRAFAPWQNGWYIKKSSKGLYQDYTHRLSDQTKPGHLDSLSKAIMYKTSRTSTLIFLPLLWGYLGSSGVWEVEIKMYGSTQTHPPFSTLGLRHD